MKTKQTLLGILLLIGCVAQQLTAQLPAAPTGLTATAYDSHIELEWDQNAEPNVSAYRIYRAASGQDFTYLNSVNQLNTSYIDFIGAQGESFDYQITAITSSGDESDFSPSVEAATFAMSDEELLTMVQAYTFRYFWDFAHPVSGMARERNTTSTVTTGGTGFGIMAILVGIERGFITYQAGVERLLKIVEFLETADRFHGAFPHWMNGATGEVIPFFEEDNGGDLVETAFLIQGLLTARHCIDGNTTEEIALREKITGIWETVEWNWYRKGVQNVLFWHWSPNYGWAINHQIRGFNEAQIVYLLAVASPTYPIPVNLYHDGWAGGAYTNGGTFFDYPLSVGPYRGGPLFFAHYSYLGFDPRFIRDDYANYFNRNIYHTLINRAYCIENPQDFAGYSEVCWGLTASDNPWGYLAHEPVAAKDNGTITPTAALSSMPYTPGHSIAALKYFYRELGADLWGKYGFYDAFNLQENWFASSYLAIDQGPIIGMIENYRTGLLWNCFMANPEILTALDEIGFVPDSTVVTGIQSPTTNSLELLLHPNPASDQITLQFSVQQAGRMELKLLDTQATCLRSVINPLLAPGKHSIVWDLSSIPNGIYFFYLKTENGIAMKRLVLQH